jgi:type II secretory pathway component PulK
MKFIRGTDRGNAVITVLVFIMVLSSITLSLIPRILSTRQLAYKYKTSVVHNIELANMEIIANYELD